MLGWTLSLRSNSKEIESIKYFRKQCFGFSNNRGIVFFWNLLAALRFVLYVNHSVIKGIIMITHASQTKIILRVPPLIPKKGFLDSFLGKLLLLEWVIPKNVHFQNETKQKPFQVKMSFHSSVYNTHKYSQSNNLLFILRGSGL